MRQYEYIVPNECDGMRVQDFLMGIHGYSRRIIVKLKKTKGDITLNNGHVRMIDQVKAKDVLKTLLYDDTYIQPDTETTVPIVFEDDDVIVYNKPYNMPVHPSRNHQTDTLANVFCGHMKAAGVQTTFRPINRLDRDTDGLCVVAKNALAAGKLSRVVKKEYTAICCGVVSPTVGRINLPIVRLDDFYIKRGVSKDGQPSATNYIVQKQNGKYSQVLISLETGRTHQIRVHLSHVGFPLAGDDMYGGDCADLKRHALTCTRVWFTHPITGEKIDISIELQDEMQSLLKE